MVRRRPRGCCAAAQRPTAALEGLLGLVRPAIGVDRHGHVSRVYASAVVSGVLWSAVCRARSAASAPGLVSTGTRSRRYWRCVRSTASGACRAGLIELRVQAGDLGLELDDPPHPLQVEPRRGQVLDAAQLGDVRARCSAGSRRTVRAGSSRPLRS